MALNFARVDEMKVKTHLANLGISRQAVCIFKDCH
jgi:hypothetical protein